MNLPSKDGKFIQATAAYHNVHTAHQYTERREFIGGGLDGPEHMRTGKWINLKPGENESQVKAENKRTVTEHKPGKSMTKFARLLADLKELREKEPDFRAVVFTKFDEVQKALVDLLADEKKAGGSLHDKEAPPLKVFQFNKHTPATSRHNKIHEFQHGKASGGSRLRRTRIVNSTVDDSLRGARRARPAGPSASRSRARALILTHES